MQLTLRQQLTQFAHLLQSALFPAVEEEIGPLGKTSKRLISILSLIPLARFVPVSRGWMGRPQKDRLAIARAFVAKAVYDFPDTRHLLDRLGQDPQLRSICGWQYARQIPHESTFSRAFAEFAQMQLPQFVHQALIRETQGHRLIGHIARDSTDIEVREAATPKQEPPQPQSQPRSRSKGGKPRKPRKAGDPPTRLERQRNMSLEQMLRELPCYCSYSAKKSRAGQRQYWRGYKLHLDVADGQIPISAVLTAAHVHDSQTAIPLSTMTQQRVTALYEVMDAAYDAQEIMEHVRSQGRVPIIDPKKTFSWGGRKSVIVCNYPRQFSWAEQQRYRERTMVERVNARLKDEFGGRHVRVRGAVKVMAHLMFGILALAADQLPRLIESG